MSIDFRKYWFAAAAKILLILPTQPPSSPLSKSSQFFAAPANQYFAKLLRITIAPVCRNAVKWLFAKVIYKSHHELKPVLPKPPRGFSFNPGKTARPVSGNRANGRDSPPPSPLREVALIASRHCTSTCKCSAAMTAGDPLTKDTAQTYLSRQQCHTYILVTLQCHARIDCI